MVKMTVDGIGKLSPTVLYLPPCNYPCEGQNCFWTRMCI